MTAHAVDRIEVRRRGYDHVDRPRIKGQGSRIPALNHCHTCATMVEHAGIEQNGFQFRDLRAKAGTDKADSASDIRQAQQQLGHASVTMTEHYVRNRRGAKVTPTK